MNSTATTIGIGLGFALWGVGVIVACVLGAWWPFGVGFGAFVVCTAIGTAAGQIR